MSYSKGLIAVVVALGVTFAAAFGVVVLLGGSGSFHDWPSPPSGGEATPGAPQQLRRVTPSDLANLALPPPASPGRPSSRPGSNTGANATAQLAGPAGPGLVQPTGTAQAAAQGAPAAGPTASASAASSTTTATIASVQPTAQLLPATGSLELASTTQVETAGASGRPAPTKPPKSTSGNAGPTAQISLLSPSGLLAAVFPSAQRQPAPNSHPRAHTQNHQRQKGHRGGHGKGHGRRQVGRGHAGHPPPGRPVRRHLGPAPRRHPGRSRGRHRGWTVGRRVGHVKSHGHRRQGHHRGHHHHGGHGHPSGRGGHGH